MLKVRFLKFKFVNSICFIKQLGTDKPSIVIEYNCHQPTTIIKRMVMYRPWITIVCQLSYCDHRIVAIIRINIIVNLF